MVKQVLKITRDAVLKRRPEPLGNVPANEQFRVTAGTEYEIQSYAWADATGDFDEHIKFALKDGNIGGFNTWFIFNRFAEVEFDGEPVYPLEEQTAIQVLRINQDTVLKRRPLPAAELKPDEMFTITKGALYDLHSYAYADATGNFNGHVKFAIDTPEQYINGFSTWYVYAPHAQVEFDGLVVYPLPKEAAPSPAPSPAPAPKPATPAPTGAYKGAKITLPGGKGTVYTDQPIVPGGVFTWGEATHGGSRPPQKPEHANNIVAAATQLEKFRKQIGKPFRITSWYRPEPFNSRAGGAKRSQHLEGKGVDIVVAGYMGRDLGKLALPWWPGGLGIYPGNRKHILHLDVGPKRNWGF